MWRNQHKADLPRQLPLNVIILPSRGLHPFIETVLTVKKINLSSRKSHPLHSFSIRLRKSVLLSSDGGPFDFYQPCGKCSTIH